jgi:hypothetical protein
MALRGNAAKTYIAERVTLDGFTLEWQEIGLVGWSECTTYRRDQILAILNQTAADDSTNFGTGYSGAMVKYNFKRARVSANAKKCTVVFEPDVPIDVMGERRRNICVQAIASGTMTLQLYGWIGNGRLQIEATYLSGDIAFRGDMSLRGPVDCSTIYNMIQHALRRRRVLTKYQTIALANGASVVKRNHRIWSPAWRGPIRVRLHGKTSKLQTAITQFFRRMG